MGEDGQLLMVLGKTLGVCAFAFLVLMGGILIYLMVYDTYLRWKARRLKS